MFSQVDTLKYIRYIGLSDILATHIYSFNIIFFLLGEGVRINDLFGGYRDFVDILWVSLLNKKICIYNF